MFALLTRKPPLTSKPTITLTLRLKPLVLLPLAVLLASCSNDQAGNQNSLQNNNQSSIQNNSDNTATQSQTKPKTGEPNTSEDTEVLRLAAAANLAGVLPSIIDGYQQHTEQHQASEIEVTYASSGKLYAQINAGAPYDVFLSADQQFPAKYSEAHPSNDPQLKPFTYARGQLALYSRNHDLSSLSNLGSERALNSTLTNALSKTGLEKLWLNDANRNIKIAIANPELAPYGASAKAFLEHIELYDALKEQKKLIQTENISQAFQYAHTASTDYGFVALSQLVSTQVATSKYQVLPPNSYPPILQDGIVISDHPQAIEFSQYLQSKPAQQLFKQAGYLSISSTGSIGSPSLPSSPISE